jgi:hypothetical protein
MWPQLITAALGIWLMFAPAVLDYSALSASHARIFGPIIAAIGWVSIWEVTRGLRWLSLPCGIVLLIVATGSGYSSPALINSVVLGLTVSMLVFAGGARRSSMGGGWAALRRSGANDSIENVSNGNLKGGEKR